MTTFAPPTIRELAAYYVAHGGTNLGIVGDTSHVATGTSYHLGKSALTADAYSRQLPRDKAGLTEAASALDLGALNGSLGELRAFSRWLVTTLPVNGLVREVIYSPDGVNVQRWSGVDGLIHTGAGNGDSSHLGHTHISFFRDTETLAKVQLFVPYFESAPQEPAMPEVVTELPPGWIAVLKPGTTIRSSPAVDPGNVIVAGSTVTESIDWPIVRRVRGDRNHLFDTWFQNPDTLLFASEDDVDHVVPPSTDPAPVPTPAPGTYTQADLDASYNAGVDAAAQAAAKARK